MVRLIVALVFLWVAPSFGIFDIQCKQTHLSQSASFTEGIDDYTLTFLDCGVPGCLGAKLLGRSSDFVVVEVQIPKLIRKPDLVPGCFLASDRPLLFNCPGHALNPKVKVTATDGATRNVTVQDSALDRFTMEARSAKREGPYAGTQFRWVYKAVADGQNFERVFLFDADECKEGSR